MSFSAQFLLYLQHYADKNIDAVAELFADDITLRDWKIAVSGKAAAVHETAQNFASAATIAIEPLFLYESTAGVAGELRILVNGETELYVVDVITFDAHGRIKSIRAYLGRGD